MAVKAKVSRTKAGEGSKDAKAKSAPKLKGVPKPKNGVQYTQSELIDVLTQAFGFQKKATTKEAMQRFVGLLQLSLKKGYKIPLPGLGKLLVRTSKARVGRNPATGETINIPSRKRIRLVVSKAFKEAVL